MAQHSASMAQHPTSTLQPFTPILRPANPMLQPPISLLQSPTTMRYEIQEFQTYSPTNAIETAWDNATGSSAQPPANHDVEPSTPKLESIQAHPDLIRAWNIYGSLVEDLGKPKFGFGYPPQAKAEAPELTLDDEVTEEERFLFEAFLKHRKLKGKGMWKIIEEEYTEWFQCKTTKSVLRHKLSKLSHHIQWPKFEVSLINPLL